MLSLIKHIKSMLLSHIHIQKSPSFLLEEMLDSGPNTGY